MVRGDQAAFLQAVKALLSQYLPAAVVSSPVLFDVGGWSMQWIVWRGVGQVGGKRSFIVLVALHPFQ